MHSMIKITLIGIGATLLIDLLGFVLGLFNIKSLDYRLVGRWLANLPHGIYFHKNIVNTAPVHGELFLGWTAHYLTGIAFAFLLFFLFGKEWLDDPAFLPALLVGIVTIVAPFFIMQPAFGFGIASSDLPQPNIRRLKSLLTHTVYGAGLYWMALLLKRF